MNPPLVGGSWSQYTVTLSNGLNSNIATHGRTSVRIVGPTGQFSIGGFVPETSGSWRAGQILTVINTTTETLTIVNEDASTTSIYRIDTQSEVPVTLPPGRKGTATFFYDGTEQRWVLQNIGMAYPVVLNPHDYGAEGNGESDDSGALSDAFAQAGTSVTPATIVELAPGTYRISSNITQPAGVMLKFQPGAEISCDSGVTLNILGMIDADKYQQIFSGLGTTTFGSTTQSPQVSVIEACWFGADPTGTNDSYPAFKACENAWVALATSYSGGPNWPAPSVGAGYPNPLAFPGGFISIARRIHIPAGCYWMTKTWFIQHTDLEIEGDGAGSLFGTNTVIVTPQGVAPLVQNVDCQPFTFRKIVLSCNGSNYNGNAPGVGPVIGTSGPYYPKWTPGTVYTAGQIVQLNFRQPYGYALQCVDGGTSAGVAFPGYFEWTLTVSDSISGDTIALNVMTSDNVIHRVSVTAGATTTATATLLAAAIAALPNAVDASGSVTSSGPVVTLKRTQDMTLPGDWNTSQLTFAFSPSNTWRANEPDLVGLVNANGCHPPGANNAYGLLRYWAPTTYFDNGDAIVEEGYFYTATSSGLQRSGPTQPAFGGATVDDGSVVWTRGNSALIDDNTATWQPVVCNAIDLLGGDARIEDVACFGYPGNGINVNSWFYAGGFNCYVKDVQLYNLGGSDIFLTGGNTGAGNTFINVNGWYARGWHIFCEAATIDTFISCMNEDAESGYFYGDSGIVIGPFKESTDSGVWLGVSAVTQGAGGGMSFITNSSLTASPAIYPDIGFSGNSAPTWQSIGASTTVAAGSLCTPQASSQPDPNEYWTYYAPCGGTTGSSEPTWYPCYGQNGWPDASFVVDGSTIWKVYNYARKSTGQTLGLDADNQKAFVNNNGEYAVYLGAATDQATGAQTGTTTMAVESFSTSDPNDSSVWGLYYDTANKMFTWRKGYYAGPAGMSYLAANNAYDAPVNNITLSCVAFQFGFYIGYPAAGDFCYFFAVENPGIAGDNQGLSFSAGAFCLSTGHGAPAGCANVFRNVHTGASYPIWKPNYAAPASGYVLSDPPNGHLYKNTGTTGYTGTTPIVWPTGGDTVSDGDTGVEWTDEGALAGGVTEWLPCAPAISEDIYYLNLSGQSSPYTLSAYEAAHRIIRIFNASENFTIIAESPDAYPDGGFDTTALQGGINTWSKIFDNQTSYIVTVAATSSDTGIAIAPDQGAFLWSDSINVKPSPPPTPTAVSTGGGADATLGTIGGRGPASAGQARWLELFDASGQKYFVPAWQ